MPGLAPWYCPPLGQELDCIWSRAFHRNSHMVIAPSASIVSLNSIRNTRIVHATKLAENHWFVDGSVVFQFMVPCDLAGEHHESKPCCLCYLARCGRKCLCSALSFRPGSLVRPEGMTYLRTSDFGAYSNDSKM